MFEMIITVTELISKFKIHPEFDDIGVTPLITLKPNNAFLRFEERLRNLLFHWSQKPYILSIS